MNNAFRYILYISYAAAFVWPIVLAIRGAMKPKRWVLCGLVFLVLSVVAFGFAAMFSASVVRSEGSEIARKAAPFAEWSVRLFVWLFLSAIGSMFGACLHRSSENRAMISK